MTDFGFASTFNMGYEGFSKPLALQRMNPIYGNKNEFLALALLFVTVPLLISGRKKNEDGLRREVKATNRYAPLALTTEDRQPSQWNL